MNPQSMSLNQTKETCKEQYSPEKDLGLLAAAQSDWVFKRRKRDKERVIG